MRTASASVVLRTRPHLVGIAIILVRDWRECRSGFWGYDRKEHFAPRNCILGEDVLKTAIARALLYAAQKLGALSWRVAEGSVHTSERGEHIKRVVSFANSCLPSLEVPIGNRNQANREIWLEQTLKKLPPGSKILDAGAGEMQYRRFCSHLEYVSQDFCQYDGKGNAIALQTGTWEQKGIDIVSDITAIPVADASFDAVMCIEVLEHVPAPGRVFAEFKRILKPGGKLILTAPFACLTHFAPHFYSTGFSRYFYERRLPENGFDVLSVDVNGNYFEYLGQEFNRLPSIALRFTTRELETDPYYQLAGKFLRFVLRDLSDRDTGSSELLSFGLHVLAEKQSQQ